MKKILILAFSLILTTVAVIAGHVIDESETPRFLFVLSAGSGKYDGETLTLTGVPSVVYFSDRPYRVAGHMSLQKFAENWGGRIDDFSDVPPNATLSLLTDNGVDNVVIEMIAVSNISEEAVNFHVEILMGDLPTEFSAGSLFIDYICNPMKKPCLFD